uniref:Uncharacterized protein n=1 Tax=Saccharum hybrid cultivar R570 TaxID=131158 RepID=A0A059PYT3_9POAL|nr:hypothetical protein SHCRBa_159_J23_R_380 [Saccharum hybrid cultivar R570]
MVMYLPPPSSSAGMWSIRHELQRRRSKPLAPTDVPSGGSHTEGIGGSIRTSRHSALLEVMDHNRCRKRAEGGEDLTQVETVTPEINSESCNSRHHEFYVSTQREEKSSRRQKRSVANKKPSVSPPPRHGSSDAVRGPYPRPPHREVPSSTNSHSRGSTVAYASPQPKPRASSRCCTPASPPPLPRSAPSSSASSAREATPGVPAHLKPGTVVRVRTRTATLKTGQVLVLCLKATIVSSSTDGGYEVVYDVNWPRGDPKTTVHVAPHQVRMINPSPSPTTPPPSLPPPTATVAATTKMEMPRPTTAGKSLRLIRSLFPEMELPAQA